MRTLPAAALLACVSFATAITAAQAGMGPCKTDARNTLLCGGGIDAARVINGTTSPDEKFAFAWRSPGGDPNNEPDKENLDLLLVRLSDGAILGKSTTGYWNTGEMRVNRWDEDVAWSPDSRLAAHAFQTRYKTERFELFAPGDAAAASLDLQKIVEPAVRKKLSKNAGSRVFTVWGSQTLEISNAGKIHVVVQMWRPKDGPEDYFDVTLNVTRGANGLKAGALSIRKTKAPQ
jgi:hypothetical protein